MSCTRQASRRSLSFADVLARIMCIFTLTVVCHGVWVMAGPTCNFTSRTYSVGEVWYSRLGQPGAIQCVACVCQEGGKINCTIIYCEDCASPNPSNAECCKYCPKTNGKSGTSLSSSSSNTIPVTPPQVLGAGGGLVGQLLRPSLIPGPSANYGTTEAPSQQPPKVPSGNISPSSSSSCLHNGQVYRHKERFTSHSVSLQQEHANQCVQCICESGMVMCQLRDCPKPECENPIRTREECCPVCPDPIGRNDDTEGSVVIIQQSPATDSKMEDCISGGRYYLHGTRWHPVMGPFGPMDCVVCECKSGRIECHRMECPSKQNMHCDRPVKVAGRCCPVCPLHSSPSADNIGSAVTSSPLPRPVSYPGDGTMLCLPPGHDIVAYKSVGGGNFSDYIQYIFQNAGRAGPRASEHHMWALGATNTAFKVQDLSRDQLDALRQRFRFSILGATNIKNLKKFTGREKKLKPKCTASTGCPKKIRRLERNLLLKEVANRKTCLAEETEVM